MIKETMEFLSQYDPEVGAPPVCTTFPVIIKEEELSS